MISKDIVIKPTGIKELDMLLHGGIPEGHVVLVCGNSGAGKTIFSLQWLYSAFREFDIPGIYITMTEPIVKSLKNVKQMDFFNESMLSPLAIHHTDLRTIIESLKIDVLQITREQVNEIIDFIENLVTESKAGGIVIDSITAMCYMLRDKDMIRYFIFRLGARLSNIECTTFMTSEVTEKGYSVYGVEEFISDGIIKLDYNSIKEETTRTIQVVKMRGVDFESDINSFRINKMGINILPKFRYFLDYRSSAERVSTGVPGLDKMCGGGVFKGSTTLVAGSTGTGKTVMSLQFLLESIKNEEPCLYVSHEESREQLLRTAKGFNWDFEGYEKAKLIIFHCYFPNRAYPFEHLTHIMDIVEKKRIKRCVIDSLSCMGNVMPDDTFRDLTTRVAGYLKYKNVTSLMTAATATLIGTEMITEAHLSTLTDNIFLLKYIEISGELKQMIIVLKARSSERDRKLRDYSISGQGIVIGESLSAFEGIMTGSTKKVGRSVSEKLTEEFVKTLGPMGLQVFNELSQKGVSEKSINDFIDTLVTDGIMKSDKAGEFRQKCLMIIESA